MDPNADLKRLLERRSDPAHTAAHSRRLVGDQLSSEDHKLVYDLLCGIDKDSSTGALSPSSLRKLQTTGELAVDPIYNLYERGLLAHSRLKDSSFTWPEMDQLRLLLVDALIAIGTPLVALPLEVPASDPSPLVRTKTKIARQRIESDFMKLRLTSAEAFVRTPSEISELIPFIRSGYPSYYERAAEKIVEIGPIAQECVSAIRDRISDCFDPFGRQLLLSALAAVRTNEAQVVYREAIQQYPDEQNLQEVALEFTASASLKDIPVLLSIMKNHSKNIFPKALDRIVQFGEMALPILSELAESQRCPARYETLVCIEAFRSAGNDIQHSSDALRLSLQDSNPLVRSMAFELLSKIEAR